MKNLSIRTFAILILFIFSGSILNINAQVKSEKGSYSWLNLDTVKAGKFDTGKMWTFDYPPVDYFESEYGFKPSEEWLTNVRMSALRFANYCSASFVSAEGLVMTNHHCGRRSITQVSKPDENLMDNGFTAATLADERPVPGLYVEQLDLIKDVTDEIQEAIDKGKTSEEKAENTKNIMKELEEKESKDTGLRCTVVTLFNGGKYSLYGYKRYDDVRLVFAPEEQAAYFGGDPDNFTYPRYDVDCSFFRVYDENGNPLKTNNYFKWSANGAEVNEPVFVVGNPGRTNRLYSVAQLEYYRDITYPYTLNLLNGLIDVYKTLLKNHPDRRSELENTIFGFSNSQKAYSGMLAGLRDPILMQKKADFEKTFKKAVQSNTGLNNKYGTLWGKIEGTRSQLRENASELYGLSVSRFSAPEYFNIASGIVDLAKELKKPEADRSAQYKGAELDSTIAHLFPADFDTEKNNLLLRMEIDNLVSNLGMDNDLVKKFTGGNKGEAAYNYVMENSELLNADDVKELAEDGADDILNSKDPFIYFTINSETRRDELQKKSKDISTAESEYNQELGKALFEVYGTSIPPDANFTLRISDGVVKGYDYNATEAPAFTTYYGMYDRYYSFDKKFPWNLPERWQNPPADFDLETPFNFVTTNDIVGGNSGSPIINKNAEIVGLAFDGNVESLPGNFIFSPEKNRCVGVHSSGMIEAIRDIYKSTRLSDELLSGKMILTTEQLDKVAH